MADRKLSQLSALTGANTASGDLLYIVDVSEPLAADQSKKITLTEFQSAPISAGTANGLLYLNASKVPTSGAGLTYDGTDLTVVGAVNAGSVNTTTLDLTNLEVTNIKAKDGTAAATIADATGKITVSTELAVDNLNLSGNTLASTDTNGNIVLAPNGTGDVQLDADTVRIGDANSNALITTNGTGDLVLNTNSGTNSGFITIEDGVNGNIIIAPNGTGQVQITNAALDLTTIEVTNIKAKDGTAAMTLADSTGVTTFAANPILNAGTANGVPYLNASKVLTTGSALTFDGTNFATTGTSTGLRLIASSTDAGGSVLQVDTTATAYGRVGGSTTMGYVAGTQSLWTIGGTEQMRLTSTGLGIGTSSPGAKLDVNGDASIYGVTVGRGAGAVSTNTAVGASALAANTTGAFNTTVGAQALTTNTTGERNTVIGRQAMFLNTTGGYNVAVGMNAMEQNTTASNSVAVGYTALQLNTTGANNVAVGYNALVSNTTASNNTAVGYQAGYSNTTGLYMVAVGYQAAFSNTSGEIAAVGWQAGLNNTTGTANSAFGRYRPLFSNTTGANNTAIGDQALYSNTTASNNTAVGYQAGYANTTGVGIVAIGAQALLANTTGSYNTAIGYALVANTIGAQNIGIGLSALEFNTTGSFNTSVGVQALRFNTTGANNSAFGKDALYSNTTASNNTAVGYQAGYSNTTGSLSVFGTFVGYANTTGVSNVAVGGTDGVNNPTFRYNTTGSYNTAMGFGALGSNTTASNNTAVGYQAGYSNTTGVSLTAVGKGALYAATGNNNTAVGTSAGVAVTTGAQNTLIGASAGSALTTGSFNTFIGMNSVGNGGSGELITTGSKNTILGGYNGNQGGLDIRTANNYIVLSDGDGNPRVFHDGSWLYSPNNIAQGNTQNINYGSGLSFGAAGKGLLFQQTVNTNDERVYLTNNAQTSTSTGSGFTGGFAYNKTGASASAYLQIAGYHQFFSAGTGTAGDLISFTSVFCTRKDETVALQGAGNHSGTGITFPATQNASSNANTLDDYEQGTWTATVSDGTNVVDLGTQYYTKIGNVVTVKFGKYNADFSSLTAGVGLQLNGLPFAASNLSAQDAVLIGSITSNNPVLYEIGTGSAGGLLYQGTNGAGISSLVKADFASTSGSLWGNFSYLTD